MTTQLLREGIVIKLRVQRRDGTPLIVLGISELNMQRLRRGSALVFPLRELGLGEGDVSIVWGQDEMTIAKELGIDVPADQIREYEKQEAKHKRRS